MKKARVKGIFIVGMCLLLGGLIPASATNLTFDFEPTLNNAADITAFTTVYGDRGATGSDGKTYLYDGGEADTPNIQVNYGAIAYISAANPEYGWKWTSYVPLFRPSDPAVAGNVYEGLAGAISSSGRMVVMLKPDPGYAVTVEGLSLSTKNGLVTNASNLQVKIYESVGDALDMSSGFVGFPRFHEGYDYNIIYSSERQLATNQKFNISVANISSNKILWICAWSPNAGNKNDIAMDNIVFSQSQREILPATCAEMIAKGLGDMTDLEGDCQIGIADLAVMLQSWLDNNDPN